MAIYNIAGLTVKMSPLGRTKTQAEKYLSKNQNKNQKVDIELNVSKERVQKSMEKHPELNESDWQYMLYGSDFYNELIKFNGMLLHSSCVVVDNEAYVFSADSGVGKSTHTKLWLKHFGERAYILNDDKPALRLIDNTVYACGTPFSGKFDISVPKIVPLKGICFISRGKENKIERADVSDAVFKILNQTLRKLKLESMNNLFDVIEEIFSKVPLFNFECTISNDAVLTSYNAMSDKKE